MLPKHLDMCQGAAMDYLQKNLWESCARMAGLVHHGTLPDHKDHTSLSHDAAKAMSTMRACCTVQKDIDVNWLQQIMRKGCALSPGVQVSFLHRVKWVCYDSAGKLLQQ